MIFFFKKDTAYTERYMGMPTLEDNLQNYQKNSPLNNVTNFKDKSYLILHGIADGKCCDNFFWKIILF